MGCPFNPVSVIYDEEGNALGIADGSGKLVLATHDLLTHSVLEEILAELKTMNQHLNYITELNDEGGD
jgi:hypothetical protein